MRSPQSLKRVLAPMVLLAVVGGLADAAGGTRLDPYNSLRSSAYPDVALPAAFSSAKISTTAPSASARSHGATGAVEVDVDGPDPSDGIVFVVFKTPSGASTDPMDAIPALAGLTVHPAGKVTGVAGGTLYRGTYTSVNALNDATTENVTYAVAPQGGVLVGGFTFGGRTNVWDVAGATALLKSGRAHVTAVGA